MRRATFLAAVQDDLLAILTYIADESGRISIGENFVRALRSQCHKLASFEAITGRPRPELRPDVRSFPYKGYVIFFRDVDDRFEIVAIVEGHRDIEARFNDAKET